MPDAKKQGRSNKAMTFLVASSPLGGITLWPDIGVIAAHCRLLEMNSRLLRTRKNGCSSMMFGAVVGAVGAAGSPLKSVAKRAG
ncbi:hypothetical protein ACLK1T_18005 [Escherichia coli]